MAIIDPFVSIDLAEPPPGFFLIVGGERPASGARAGKLMAPG